MENILDLKLVIKHLTNGTLSDNLCIICLMPLEQRYEHIFTTVCREDKEYCIADILQDICHIEISSLDNYNVCVNCFMMASMAYKFYLQSKRSNEILNYYSDLLLNNLNEFDLPDLKDTKSNTLGINLPLIVTKTPIYDFNLYSIVNKPHGIEVIKNETVTEIKKEVEDDDSNVIIIITESGEPAFYRLQNGNLELLNESETRKYKQAFTVSVDVGLKEEKPKRLRKRVPMLSKFCTRCPGRYKFAAKLQKHMKVEHHVDLYVCKVCKAMTEDKQEYHTHLKTHTNIHQCAYCNTVFKKRSTIIKHLKWHEKMKNISKAENAHICEVCGVILENEECLSQHYDSKHNKKFICYYCGKMYKRELGFEMHIKKHDANTLKKRQKLGEIKVENPSPSKKEISEKFKCDTCGRYFVDERALLWHQRLHNNEKPYICKVCGRGFVSMNRRNQHSLCAHTLPARRCPLCPSLFHLRSMVNTHVKKVHLKTHKRRNRLNKYQNVFWRTETVPIQELSVDIQNDILELQAANNDQKWVFQDNETTPMEMTEI